MPPVSKRFVNPKISRNIWELLVKAIGKADKRKELMPLFRDLLTPTERVMIAKRLAVAFLLLRKDYDQRQIGNTLKVSTATVARVNLILKTQGQGYRLVLERVLRDEVLKVILNEIYEIFTPLPLKGVNWGMWKKYRKERKNKLHSF